MNTTVKFAKVNPNAIIPSKIEENAGYDIYACFEDEYMLIVPHTTEMIPTGIASACDKDYSFILKERGSTGTKGIAQRCGVIDSGYRGEWFVPLTNTTSKYIVICKKHIDIEYMRRELGTNSVVIYPYEKAICQALLIPVPHVDVEEYTYDELLKIDSERGSGKLGSSTK